MDKKRIESYKEFAKYLEYPMIMFEAESGKVLDINYEAELLLGSKIENIKIEPGRAIKKVNFWEKLHDQKSLMWNRIRLMAGEHEYLVSGLINETTIDNCVIYTMLFETQPDLNLGNIIMERILSNAKIVALHLSNRKGEYKVEYVSQNINQYGYTREQMYDGIVKLADIVCSEDWDRVKESVLMTAKNRKEESSLECRAFTEAGELIPIRIHNHYVYDDYGNPTHIELLVFDLRDEMRRNHENAYLSRAVEKMKSVVVVKSYHKGERILKYVSPNAGMIGMNAEALMKGYKLTEDYVHPSDRDMVIDTVYLSVANGVTDYEQCYRLVRDDGKQIWVQNEVTVNRISDGEAEISFLLTDITEQKNMEREMALTLEGEETSTELKEKEYMEQVTIDQYEEEVLGQFQLMAETLNQNADYYCVVLDTEGKLVTQPVGPMKDMGQFYDLFERPQYKEKFDEVSLRVKDDVSTKSISFTMDKIQVYMIFAPLMLEDAVTAYWVVTSFAKNGQEILGTVIEQQWRLANSIAKGFYAENMAQAEAKKRKMAEVHLQREQRGHQVALDIMNTMNREGEACLGEICQKAGSHLSVADIGIYLENKETGNVEKYFLWDRAGEDVSLFDRMELSISEYQELKHLLKDNRTIIFDRSVGNPFLKNLIGPTNAEIFMIRAMISGNDIRGYIVFSDTDRTHIFDEKDINFASSVTYTFTGMLLNNQTIAKAEHIKEGFFEAYDHIKDAVFVKNNKTGEIIFANKSMDKLFGYSLVGMQARDVVKDQYENYKNMGGLRKRFITNKKVSKWQSYMKELDQIMNIVEIHLETLNKADYSLFILKKNKNKKNESES